MFVKSYSFEANEMLEHRSIGALDFKSITPTPVLQILLFRQRVRANLEVHGHQFRAFATLP
jgi:hypothetical protein